MDMKRVQYTLDEMAAIAELAHLIEVFEHERKHDEDPGVIDFDDLFTIARAAVESSPALIKYFSGACTLREIAYRIFRLVCGLEAANGWIENRPQRPGIGAGSG